MSDRGRSRKGGAGGVDLYETPSWCVDLLRDAWPDLFDDAPMWDPCWGRGAIAKASPLDPEDWLGADVEDHGGARPGSFYEQDCCELNPRVMYGTIVTNPPYNDAFRIAQWAVRCRCDAVVMLLPIGWLGAKNRSEWLVENTPDRLYILSDRPSFDGRGTGGYRYAWIAWTRYGGPNLIRVLPHVPVEVRKRSEGRQ